MAKKNDIVKAEAAAIQSVEQIESLILTIRDKQVILDRDLARLYGVETRVLNQAVQRNIERFPEDFMFQLTKEEAESSRSQFVMLNADGDENMSSQFYSFTHSLFNSFTLYLSVSGIIEHYLHLYAAACWI